MYSVKLARELAEEGFTVIREANPFSLSLANSRFDSRLTLLIRGEKTAFHPGYVRTDMNNSSGQQNGDLETSEAADLAYVFSFFSSFSPFYAPNATAVELLHLVLTFCRTKNIFLAVTKEDNGKFKNYDGKDLPW
jgi:hypothetical protein